MDSIKILQKMIHNSNNIVAFTGAGCSTESGVPDFRSPDGIFDQNVRTNDVVSTESGIPDFRSVDGLYNQSYRYPPETIISHSFFERDPEEFYHFYKDRMLYLDAVPNAAHRKLAELERAGRLRAVITQNIDGLHQAAGSREVLELHGSVHRNYCTRCGREFDARYVKKAEGVPVCDACGGMLKPDGVLYEEALDSDLMYRAVDYIRRAEVLIIGGTSLVVYPAAGLVNYYQGDKLVLINNSPTAMDMRADLVISGPIGEVLGQIQVN